MRVGVNTRFLLKDKLEGIGVFTYQVVKRMVLLHPEIEFVFFFDRKFDESFVFADNVTPVVVNPQARHPLLWFTWFEVSLPYYLKKYRIDYFFSPDGYLSLRYKMPQSVVIHDLAFEHFPQYVSKNVAKYYKKYTPLYCQKAENIFTVSEFTKNDIVQRYDVDQNKISVVYNGFDQDVLIPKAIALPHQYFLYVGALHPRKNICNLLKAFDLFKQDDEGTKLVLVGREAWGNTEMKRAYEQMEYRDDVLFTGRISDEELAYVYANALALVYVSLFEGFGIPIIEAQAYGIPVITSKSSSMPEVAGDGGVFVNPSNTSSIANGMSLLANDEELRREYVLKGRRNLVRFNWDYTAQKIMDVILKTIC